MTQKLLFWNNGLFLHFSLASYLQSKLKSDFYAITDVHEKHRTFFENQTLVNFKKNWFFHDYIIKNDNKPDLDYLFNFEEKYGIDLWKLALNERFFYRFNRFYKFTKDEILTILEQEIRLFELILDEINPDYFLTYDPVFHHQKLLLDICRKKGINVLSVCSTRIKNKSILVENGATFDINSNIQIKNISKNKNILTDDSYSSIIQNYVTSRNVNFSKKLIALKDYLLFSNSENIHSNFMYYGKTKFSVIKDAMYLELKRKKNYKFLEKNSVLSPDLSPSYIYFPMAIDEEMNLLHYAPFYTNQIEVIRHIAKSIPIQYHIYVKEHISAGLRGWRNSEYYKKIIEIPNVTLIHPLANHDDLLKNSDLLITIRGTTALTSIKHKIPSITFGDQPFEILPSAYKVKSINELPKLIKTALKQKVESYEYEKYETLLEDKSFNFDILEFEVMRNNYFFSGGIFSDMMIPMEKMSEFIKNNEKILTELIDTHLKILSK